MEDENKNQRIARIEDFLLNPDKAVFQSLDEFKTAIDTLLPILSRIDPKKLQTIQGQDGKTPERGVDYFNQDDIEAIEAFILSKLPVAGEDFATITETKKWVHDEVAKIPLLKGDKGESGEKGEDGKDGSSDTGEEILTKLRALPKNKRIGISDIRGLQNELYNVKQSQEDDVKRLEDTINSLQVTIPVSSGSGGGGGGTPGGSNMQLQYNNSGAFGGISGATTDGTAVTLTSPTIETSMTANYATASTIALFDSSKNLISADTATYPSLTELSYLKGTTSSLQTQLDSKENKTKLSPIPVSVTTAAGTAAKVGTTSGGSYTPAVGDIILLNFTNSNTAYNPTLNIDGSGNIAIRVAGQQPTNLAITGTSFIVYYDGTYYEALGSQRVSDYNPVTVNTEASFVVSSTSPVNANTNYFHIADSSSRITYNLAASTVAYASLAIIGKGSGGFRVAPASGDSVYMDDQVITYPGYIDFPQGGYIKLMSTTQNDVWTVETYIGEAVTDAGYNFSIATLGKGGTGASLSDPNADRLMFWDDSNGKIDWLTVGTGLNITGTTLTATGGGTVTFGSPTQIPYTNGSSDDFSYTSGFTFDGTDLEIPGGIRLGGNILDANGNEVIEIVGTASAVNQISVTNSAAGDPVEIAASGGDTDISLVLQPKGAGVVNIISPEITVGSDAQGDTYYRNGSGGFTRLPIGTAGQVLAVNSGATAPEWVPASSGSVPWTDVTGTSQAASVNNGYLADNAAEVTITLPATFAEGDIVIVVGKNSGGYKVQAASGDEITLYTTPSSSGGHVQGQQGTYTRFVASIANQMWIAEASSNTITLDGAVVPDITTNSPEGFLVNGKIVVTVSSNNITVALKQMNGSDATSSSPIYIRLNDSIRAVTGALSVTKNAGTNWFNAGSSELATKEIDYFVYLGYNATDGVVIGFCRFPYMNQYSQFSTTSTNERYCAISTITNATSTDYYAVIGRFAATLSAGAGYTWSVPTFTAINLINRPIFETRLLVWTPTYSGNDSMTFSSVTTYNADYRIYGSMAMAHLRSTGTTGGTASTELRATMPFGLNNFANALFGISVRDTSSNISGWAYFSSSNVISGNRYDAANFGLGANRNLDFVINYDIS